MNVSAYEALRHDITEVLNGFAWLAELRAEAAARVSRTSLQAVIDVANLGSTLPLILFHRTERSFPGQGAVPSFVASIFKASRGLFSGAIAMLNDGREPELTVTTEEILAFVEGHGDLRRPETGRVCAAPTRLIGRTVEVILSGRGAESDRSGLADHVDGAQLWAYFSLHDSLSSALSTYRFVLENLSRDHPGATPEQLYGVGVEVAGRRGSFGDLTEAVIQTASVAQARMNEVLGRSGDAPPLDVRGLLQIL